MQMKTCTAKGGYPTGLIRSSVVYRMWDQQFHTILCIDADITYVCEDLFVSHLLRLGDRLPRHPSKPLSMYKEIEVAQDRNRSHTITSICLHQLVLIDAGNLPFRSTHAALACAMSDNCRHLMPTPCGPSTRTTRQTFLTSTPLGNYSLHSACEETPRSEAPLTTLKFSSYCWFRAIHSMNFLIV